MSDPEPFFSWAGYGGKMDHHHCLYLNAWPRESWVRLLCSSLEFGWWCSATRSTCRTWTTTGLSASYPSCARNIYICCNIEWKGWVLILAIDIARTSIRFKPNDKDTVSGCRQTSNDVKYPSGQTGKGRIKEEIYGGILACGLKEHLIFCFISYDSYEGVMTINFIYAYGRWWSTTGSTKQDGPVGSSSLLSWSGSSLLEHVIHPRTLAGNLFLTGERGVSETDRQSERQVRVCVSEEIDRWESVWEEINCS